MPTEPGVGGHTRVFGYRVVERLKVVRKHNVLPEWVISGWDAWGWDGNRQLMEDDISLCLEHATIVIWVGYPNEISLYVLGITEEASSFTTRFKFCGVVCEYTCCAFCAKWVEVGEVGFVIEP
jgi:hypothetical protein